jgi:hypothetical protein
MLLDKTTANISLTNEVADYYDKKKSELRPYTNVSLKHETHHIAEPT